MISLSEKWMSMYEKGGALWVHDGNPLRPHALLSSGKHSDGFFNSELVMEDPSSFDEACEDLANLLDLFPNKVFCCTMYP